MKRGEISATYFDPVEGSEQKGTGLLIIVSQDAINEASPVGLAVPCPGYRKQHIYSSQVLLRVAEGGLDLDSVPMAEQVWAIHRRRLGRLRGILSDLVSQRLDPALLIVLA